MHGADAWPMLPVMGARNPARQRLISIIAALERHHPADPRIPCLRAELATEGLAEHIARVVDAAPPLTDDQRIRLTRLLNPGAGHAT